MSLRSTKNNHEFKHPADVQGQTIIQPRNKTKAEVRVEYRNGEAVLVKDYSKRNPLIRIFYGRFSLNREKKAYSRLSGVPGIPGCYEVKSKDRLELEYIPGRSMGRFRRHEVKEAVFDKLDAVIAAIHARGVAVGDLHRSNIIVNEKGDVYIVDFASAIISSSPNPPDFLTRLVMKLDLHAAARIRSRYLRQGKPIPKGFFGVLYITGKFFKTCYKKIKLIFIT
jgi:RIO-like serine/threonine protein kinase